MVSSEASFCSVFYLKNEIKELDFPPVHLNNASNYVIAKAASIGTSFHYLLNVDCDSFLNIFFVILHWCWFLMMC